MTCESYQELIALYIEGDLPSEEIARVKQHMSECSGCRVFADGLKQSQTTLKKLKNDTQNKEVLDDIRQRVLQSIAEKESAKRRRFVLLRWPPGLAVAAAVVFLLTTGLILFHMFGVPVETVTPSKLPVPQTKFTDQYARLIDFEGKIEVKPKDEFGWKTGHRNMALQEGDMIRTAPDSSARIELQGGGEMIIESDKTVRLDKRIVKGLPPVVSRNFLQESPANISADHAAETSVGNEFAVTGDTPAVDVTSTTTGRNISEDENGGADVADLSISGPSGLEHSYSFDGKVQTPPRDEARRLENKQGVLGGKSGTVAGSPKIPVPAREQPPADAKLTSPVLHEIDEETGEASAELRERLLRNKPTSPGFASTFNLRARKSKDRLLIVAKREGERDGREQYRWDAIETPTQGTLRARNREGELVGQFPLKHTEVTVDISGYLARTIVEQQYVNSFKEPIEAVYVFPLPTMAAVNDFVMEIGKRRIVGIVRPREEAERIYREARARGQTASLLTQERPNIFTQNVANIEAGGKVTIKITYFERLAYERGYYEYVFPMVVGPRYIPGKAQPAQKGKENGGGWSASTDQVPDADKITPPVLKPQFRSGHDIGLTVQLDAGMPIQILDCKTHRVKMKNEGTSRRLLKLVKEDSIPNRDFVLRWSVADKETQFGVLSHYGEEGGFFTVMMQPPLEPSDEQVTPREITFILDVSGSMSGIPIEMSKEIAKRTLDRLRPDDLFNIFYFASGNGQLWERPQPRTPENVATAKGFLRALRGGGGTEMLAGLQRALRAGHDPQYLQMYAFLTDGFVGNEAAILRLVKEERGEARFFAFGIGSSVNRYLIDGIGKHGGGVSHVVIPRDHDHASHAVDRFFECIDSPVLVDIEIDWNGLPVREVFPNHVSDLFAGQTIAVIGRYQRAAKGTAYVKARVGARPVRYEIQVNFPKREKRNASLAPVWARNKIRELSAGMLTAQPDARSDLVRRITDLGVRFRLVSQYTSFVAVDESRIVSDGKPLKVLQPVELPESVSYEGVFGEQPVGQAVYLRVWGIALQMTESGRIRVAQLDPDGQAARAGLQPGAILSSVNRVFVQDLRHLEGLLLQSSGKVSLEFEPGGSVTFRAP